MWLKTLHGGWWRENCEKLIHTPAFVQAHQSRLNGFCVADSWRRGRRGIAVRNLDDLAGEGIGKECGGEQQKQRSKGGSCRQG